MDFNPYALGLDHGYINITACVHNVYDMVLQYKTMTINI